jgi:hypothetical protein
MESEMPGSGPLPNPYYTIANKKEYKDMIYKQKN